MAKQAFTTKWHEGCERKLPHTPEKTKIHLSRAAAISDAVATSKRTNSIVYVNWHNAGTKLFHATVKAAKVDVFPQ